MISLLLAWKSDVTQQTAKAIVPPESWEEFLTLLEERLQITVAAVLLEQEDVQIEVK